MSNFINKLPILLLFFCASPHTWAYKDPDRYKESADSKVRNPRPYFSMAYSLGTNFLSGAPDEMKLNRLSSWEDEEDFCYYFPTKIPWLVVSVGVGKVTQRYNFKQCTELSEEKYDGTISCKVRAKNDPYGLHELLCELFPNNKNVTSTSLSVTYIRVILPALRIKITPEVWVSLESVLLRRWRWAKQDFYYKKGGYDFRARDFNLRRYVWDFTARVGWNGISIFYTQALTGLFEKDMGPKNGIKPWSIGINFSIT